MSTQLVKTSASAEFLGWQDSAPHKAPGLKIAEGALRYAEKFGLPATLCLLNQADATTVEGLEVRVVGYVQRNNFWIGRSDSQHCRQTEQDESRELDDPGELPGLRTAAGSQSIKAEGE